MNTSIRNHAPRAGVVLARPWQVGGLLAPVTAGFDGTRMPAPRYARIDAGFAVKSAGTDATAPSGHRTGSRPI